MVPDRTDPLVLDLVAWVCREPRTYADVMDAWRTSCPRLTIWEDALEQGLVERRSIDGLGSCVIATEAGRELVRTGARPDPSWPRPSQTLPPSPSA